MAMEHSAKAITPPSGLRLLAIYLAALAAILSPLLQATVPPLVDFPSHLVRMAILADPAETPNYVVHWRVVPNLAMDLIVPTLGGLVGIETAGRLFIAATLCLLAAATILLHRALYGRVGLWPLAAFLFLYNKVFYYGFMNYLFGLGVALLCFGLWIMIRSRSLPIRLVLFSILASLIFVMHLFAFGVYGLLIGSYELGRLWADRPITAKRLAYFVALFVQFVPAVAFWLSAARGGVAHYTEYGDLVDKVIALMVPLDFGGIFTSMLAPVVILSALILWRRGVIRIAPVMAWPILACIITAVLMPNYLYGSWGADFRLPAALPFLAIGATEPVVTRQWAGRLAAAGMVGLLVLRVASVTLVWRQMDRDYAEFRTAAQALPRDAHLLVAQLPFIEARKALDDRSSALAPVELVAFRHMADLAVMDRDIFVPTLEMQMSLAFESHLGPVEQSPQNEDRFPQQGLPLDFGRLIAGASPVPGIWASVPASQAEIPDEIPYWVRWPRKFDYVLLLDFGDHQDVLPDVLQSWHRGSFFTIYRVNNT
jgi:hypothetical protein